MDTPDQDRVQLADVPRLAPEPAARAVLDEPDRVTPDWAKSTLAPSGRDRLSLASVIAT
jgi:hypothetical protein